jgi:hypothetical protein
MKEAIDQLLDFIKQPEVVRGFTPVDWNRLISQARFHELMVLIYDTLQERELMRDAPVEIDELLSGYSNRQAYLTTLFHWEIGKVGALVSQVHYPVLVLKGMAYLLARLGSWKSRAFADIDLLVAPQHFEDFERRLQGAGWKFKEMTDYDDRYYREWSHAPPPLINQLSGIELDLHHHISAPISDQPIDTERLIAKKTAVDGLAFFRLDDADLILHCANHFIYFDNLQGRFKDVVLIYLILRESDDRQIWHSLDERAQSLGLGPTFYYLVRLLQYYFDIEVPDAIESRLKDRVMRKTVLWLLINSLTPDRVDGLGLKLIGMSLIARYQWSRYPVHILVYHVLHKHVIRRVLRVFKSQDKAA